MDDVLTAFHYFELLPVALKIRMQFTPTHLFKGILTGKQSYSTQLYRNLQPR